jgi:hypothetical protein
VDKAIYVRGKARLCADHYDVLTGDGMTPPTHAVDPSAQPSGTPSPRDTTSLSSSTSNDSLEVSGATIRTLQQIAEQIIRDHETFCDGHFKDEAPWCSCAPAGTPLCESCTKLRDAIVAALLSRDPQRTEEKP